MASWIYILLMVVASLGVALGVFFASRTEDDDGNPIRRHLRGVRSALRVARTGGSAVARIPASRRERAEHP